MSFPSDVDPPLVELSRPSSKAEWEAHSLDRPTASSSFNHRAPMKLPHRASPMNKNAPAKTEAEYIKRKNRTQVTLVELSRCVSCESNVVIKKPSGVVLCYWRQQHPKGF